MTADILSDIISDDPYGPFPKMMQAIRCHLSTGEIIHGTVARVWLDLDTVRIDMMRNTALIRVTPASGDAWEPLE